MVSFEVVLPAISPKNDRLTAVGLSLMRIPMLCFGLWYGSLREFFNFLFPVFGAVISANFQLAQVSLSLVWDVA